MDPDLKGALVGMRVCVCTPMGDRELCCLGEIRISPPLPPHTQNMHTSLGYMQVAVDMDFDHEKFKLHTKVNKGGIIPGW